MGEKQKSNNPRTPKARARRRRPPMRQGYICECRVCGNGLVRFWKYRDELVALCDECELVWDDVAKLANDTATEACGSYPAGSDGSGTEEDWKPATRRDVVRAELEDVIAGYSE